MQLATRTRAARQYQGIGVNAGVIGANPHQLIDMLLLGALERIAIARGAMTRGEYAEKGGRISAAISIIQELTDSLDFDRGGELALNMAMIYEYAMHQLIHANRQNDPEVLDEVTGLLAEIRGAWQDLPAEMARQDSVAPAVAQ